MDYNGTYEIEILKEDDTIPDWRVVTTEDMKESLLTHVFE